MARINRSSVLLWLQDVLGLQSGAQAPPLELEPRVQPTVDINPKISNVIKTFVNSVSGTTTIYTTPSDKDFYLTFAALGLTKDATADLTLSGIQITTDGATKVILPLPLQTTTAESVHIQLSFPYPLKCDRGTTIQMLGSFTVGAASRRGAIGGFILE